MAVREALLTLLAVEPTYGFRLHSELIRRLPHRSSLNVGQSYATLERARKAGLVEPAGSNDDGLPLFRLTDTGSKTVRDWLAGHDGAGTPTEETSDRVLLVLSLDELLPNAVQPELPILDSELIQWSERILPDDVTIDSLERAANALESGHATAMVNWLRKLSQLPAETLRLAIATDRARRGRPKRADHPSSEVQLTASSPLE